MEHPRHAREQQDIEDYLQGFCDSEYMKGYADYIGDGCKRFMKAHHRPMVGKFLHGEEKFAASLSKTKKPERIRSVCTDLGKGFLPRCVLLAYPAMRRNLCPHSCLPLLLLLNISRLSRLSPSRPLALSSSLSPFFLPPPLGTRTHPFSFQCARRGRLANSR